MFVKKPVHNLSPVYIAHRYTIFHGFQALVEQFLCPCLQFSDFCICKKKGPPRTVDISLVPRPPFWE